MTSRTKLVNHSAGRGMTLILSRSGVERVCREVAQDIGQTTLRRWINVFFLRLLM